WDLVNSQEPMPNSVVAALVHPVLHGICIPIHQTKQLEGEPHGRPSRQEGSEAFHCDSPPLWHHDITRLQIKETRYSNVTGFLLSAEK
ncbi:hypothetical protein, partial [Pseudoalteromonas sp. H103]|uniref:hypothetical protein n=1 Tax=Pseudoalteromonas sp. H103 TaxID=1761893 RepID=UPI0007323D1D